MSNGFFKLVDCTETADLLRSNASGQYCWHQYDTAGGDAGRFSIYYPTEQAARDVWPNPEWEAELSPSPNVQITPVTANAEDAWDVWAASFPTRSKMQDELKALLESYAEAQGTTMQAALRDALTDLRHLAEYNKLDFEAAVEGAEAVFEEEQADTH